MYSPFFWKKPDCAKSQLHTVDRMVRDRKSGTLETVRHTKQNSICPFLFLFMVFRFKRTHFSLSVICSFSLFCSSTKTRFFQSVLFHSVWAPSFFTCLCVYVCLVVLCVSVCLHTWLLGKLFSSRQRWANLQWWEYNYIISGKVILC